MTLVQAYISVAIDQLSKLDGLLAQHGCPAGLHQELGDLRALLVADLAAEGIDPRLLAPAAGRSRHGARH